MKLVILTVEQRRFPGLGELIDYYHEKLNHFAKTEIIYVPATRLDRDSREKKCELESQSLLKRLEPKDIVILLDEVGQKMNSLEFSKRLSRHLESGGTRVVVIVGGSFGANAELKSRANELWSLSPLTFSHPVALIVACEQLYRGGSISRNLPYHN